VFDGLVSGPVFADTRPDFGNPALFDVPAGMYHPGPEVCWAAEDSSKKVSGPTWSACLDAIALAFAVTATSCVDPGVISSIHRASFRAAGRQRHQPIPDIAHCE